MPPTPPSPTAARVARPGARAPRARRRRPGLGWLDSGIDASSGTSVIAVPRDGAAILVADDATPACGRLHEAPRRAG
ncbi:hypothetical protein ACFOE1_00005 [Agromyces mediolanus]|uniref:hypothetical protein n=1 Tax=Agromyces mediolanus TaxID=41986 RepID=UPI00361C1B65